jgi:hypothetical protein
MFIFFILLVFGFVFYSKIEARNIGIQQTQAEDLKSIEVAQLFSFLPELQCTNDNVPVSNCMDMMKLDALSRQISANADIKNYYYDMFLRSRITVQELYPNRDNPQGDKTWAVYDNSNFDWKRKVASQIPVSLYNSTGDPLRGVKPYYSFGIIEVEVYS